MDPKSDKSRESDASMSGQMKPMDRRAALARLGLAAGAAYLAPTLLTLKGALAKGPGPSDPSGGPPWKPKSKPSKPSK